MDNKRWGATYIVRKLNENGHQALFAGGAVRDLILGREPNDYDIATSAHPEQVQKIFKNTKAVGKSFGVILVQLNGDEFEVATFRNDGDYTDGRRPDSVSFTRSAWEDAERRDFTINALFYCPLTNQILDFVNGMRDIEKGTVRFVGDSLDRIEEDKLRMLRLIRFALKLDFKMGATSFSAVQCHASDILNVSSERIREELVKMLELNRPKRMFKLLHKSGLLHYILPEIEALINDEQDPTWHPEGNTFKHTLMTLENLNGENTLLKLAGLFHDVGKPATHEVRGGRITNRLHASVGKEMTEEIMRRLKFSNDEIETVTALVHNHMKAHVAKNMRKSRVKRLLQNEWAPDLIKLCRADQNASHKNTGSADYLQGLLDNLEPEELKPEPLINGHDLINMGFKPGPIFKKILDTVMDAQLEGTISTREEALSIVRNME